MLAIGVGGADAVDALTGTPWELKAPKIIGAYTLSLVFTHEKPNICLQRCSFDWTAERLGYTEGLDLAPRWQADRPGKLTAILWYSDGIEICACQGGTGAILEYFGPGVFNQSCTGMHPHSSISRSEFDLTCIYAGLATIANMGAEVGATTSTFPYTPGMRAYLQATGRAPVAAAADQAAQNGYLAADKDAQYDDVIEVVRAPCAPPFIAIC